ncbi:MAG: hypothetical protein HUU54_10130 [Ignavibacteriaceae bacterium]|nr:hypothetical protein [Ignavibacteriaceae bacterium]
MNKPHNLFDQQSLVFTNPTVKEIIHEFEHTFNTQLSATRKNIIQKIHNVYKDSMKLRLSGDDGTQHSQTNIRLEILPDKDNYFINKIQQNYRHFDFRKIRILNDFITSTVEYESHIKETELYPNYKLLKESAQEQVKLFDLKKIIKELFTDLILNQTNEDGINDVLGSYFITTQKIEIYYVPVMLFAILHNLSYSSLFTVVLAHEYAHAYHFAGSDADGNGGHSLWAADRACIESMAQFYTEDFCIKSDISLLGTHNAYKTLLDNQPEDYRHHIEWRKKYTKENLRLGLLGLRNRRISGITELVFFLDKLKKENESGH